MGMAEPRGSNKAKVRIKRLIQTGNYTRNRAEITVLAVHRVRCFNVGARTVLFKLPYAGPPRLRLRRCAAPIGGVIRALGRPLRRECLSKDLEKETKGGLRHGAFLDLVDT